MRVKVILFAIFFPSNALFGHAFSPIPLTYSSHHHLPTSFKIKVVSSQLLATIPDTPPEDPFFSIPEEEEMWSVKEIEGTATDVSADGFNPISALLTIAGTVVMTLTILAGLSMPPVDTTASTGTTDTALERLSSGIGEDPVALDEVTGLLDQSAGFFFYE